MLLVKHSHNCAVKKTVKKGRNTKKYTKINNI